MKVGINGFGRIGRCLFRLNYEANQKKKFEIVALKDVIPIENIAYLLKFDSHYGNFKGSVEIEKNDLIIDGQKIPYFNEPDATKIPWSRLGADILVESSGKMSGATSKSLCDEKLKNVIVTRSADDADITLIHGFNQDRYDGGSHRVVSGGSCTGNALVPIASVIHNHFKIVHAHLITVHPVLSDQRLIDTAHSKFNLGRNALMSIIPNSTGIGDSLSTAIPELKNKITTASYRIPTTVVGAINVSFHLEKETTAQEVNSLLKKYSENELKGVIEYDEGFLGHSKVSIDFLKSTYSVTVLSLETQAHGKYLSLSLFHDNEWAYCSRIHELISYIYGKNQGK